MEVLSRLDLYEIGRQYVLTRARRIEPTQVDTEGSDINLFVGSQSHVASAISRQLGDRTAQLFLDSCEGEDLDRYAWDRYQVTRKGAAAALGTVTFARLTAAAGLGTVDVGTKLLTRTGVEYVLYTPAVFGPLSLTATAKVRAAQAGREFQVGRNQIVRIDNVGALFDQTLTVNNDDVTAGGMPAEDDPTFKERVRDFWRTARRGTVGAVEFGARTVAGVTYAKAVEEITDDGKPARIIRLFISDGSGVASRALADEVDSALLDYRAGGIYVFVDLSIPLIVNLTLKLTFVAGVNTATLATKVRAAVVDFVNSVGTGQPLYRSDLGAVLARFRADGLIANDETIAEPVGDVVPPPGLTVRTTLANVTVT